MNEKFIQKSYTKKKKQRKNIVENHNFNNFIYLKYEISVIYM